MKQLLSKSLAQIVNEDERTSAIFEKYHLDFCCKGKTSLEDACREKGLMEEEILGELAKLTKQDIPNPPIDPARLSAAALADYIVDIHHSYVKNEMPRIMNLLEKVASIHGDRHPEMKEVAALFAGLKEEMELHMQKEEIILFPRIAEIEEQYKAGALNRKDIMYLASPVMMMEEEHDHAGNHMAQIRLLTHDYMVPADACSTYQMVLSALEVFEIDLHRHVHLENHLLFPKALGMLKENDSRNIQ